MKTKPKHVLLGYCCAIVFFAACYYLVPDAVPSVHGEFINSLYFSVVTITTLGYGDISPSSDLGKLLVSVEAVLGIVTIGFFLSVTSSLIDRRSTKAQVQREFQTKQMENKKQLLVFSKYLELLIIEFHVLVNEVTTPIGVDGVKNKRMCEVDFPFSSLRNICVPSRIIKDGGRRPAYAAYLELQDALANELKFVLANYDLSEFHDLQVFIIEYLKNSRDYDIRRALDTMYSVVAKDLDARNDLWKEIEIQGAEPDRLKHRDTRLTPVIFLFDCLNDQIPLVIGIENEIDALRLALSAGDFDTESRDKPLKLRPRKNTWDNKS